MNFNTLDFRFWSENMAHVVKCEPSILQELKEIVEDFGPEKARTRLGINLSTWYICYVVCK